MNIASRQHMFSFVLFFMLLTLLVEACFNLIRLVFFTETYDIESKLLESKKISIYLDDRAMKIDTSMISKNNLFGEYYHQPYPISLTQTKQPKIKIIYNGGVVAKNNVNSIAIVTCNNEQTSLSIGDLIPGTDIKLLQIHPDMILISNDGMDEEIYF